MLDFRKICKKLARLTLPCNLVNVLLRLLGHLSRDSEVTILGRCIKNATWRRQVTKVRVELVASVLFPVSSGCNRRERHERVYGI